MIREADLDGDGQINFQEYKTLNRMLSSDIEADINVEEFEAFKVYDKVLFHALEQKSHSIKDLNN